MRRAWLALPVAVCATLVPEGARADGYQFGFDLRHEWMRPVPSLKVHEQTGELRDVRDGRLPSYGAQHFLGLGLDMAWAYRDRWVFPLIGVTLATAVGPSSRAVSSLDGAIVEVRGWTSRYVGVALPGLGLRFKERRWMFQGLARPYLENVWVNASLFQGVHSQDLEGVWGVAASIRLDAEVCRRLDPETRLCVLVAPRLFSFAAGAPVGAPLAGAGFAVRWEVGR